MRIFLFTYRNDDSCQFWYFLQSVCVHLWSSALEPHRTVVFFNCAWLIVAYHNPHYMPFTVVFSKLVLKKMVRSKLDADDCDKECSYKHNDSIHKREIVDYVGITTVVCGSFWGWKNSWSLIKGIQIFFKSPLFCFHCNCSKVCPTDSDFFLAYLVPLDVDVVSVNCH